MKGLRLYKKRGTKPVTLPQLDEQLRRRHVLFWGPADDKLLQIAAVVNGVHNGNTDPSIACKQIAEILGEPF